MRKVILLCMLVLAFSSIAQKAKYEVLNTTTDNKFELVQKGKKFAIVEKESGEILRKWTKNPIFLIENQNLFFEFDRKSKQFRLTKEEKNTLIDLDSNLQYVSINFKSKDDQIQDLQFGKNFELHQKDGTNHSFGFEIVGDRFIIKRNKIYYPYALMPLVDIYGYDSVDVDGSTVYPATPEPLLGSGVFDLKTNKWVIEKKYESISYWSNAFSAIYSDVKEEYADYFKFDGIELLPVISKSSVPLTFSEVTQLFGIDSTTSKFQNYYRVWNNGKAGIYSTPYFTSEYGGFELALDRRIEFGQILPCKYEWTNMYPLLSYDGSDWKMYRLKDGPFEGSKDTLVYFGTFKNQLKIDNTYPVKYILDDSLVSWDRDLEVRIVDLNTKELKGRIIGEQVQDVFYLNQSRIETISDYALTTYYGGDSIDASGNLVYPVDMGDYYSIAANLREKKEINQEIIYSKTFNGKSMIINKVELNEHGYLKDPKAPSFYVLMDENFNEVFRTTEYGELFQSKFFPILFGNDNTMEVSQVYFDSQLNPAATEYSRGMTESAFKYIQVVDSNLSTRIFEITSIDLMNPPKLIFESTGFSTLIDKDDDYLVLEKEQSELKMHLIVDNEPASILLKSVDSKLDVFKIHGKNRSYYLRQYWEEGEAYFYMDNQRKEEIEKSAFLEKTSSYPITYSIEIKQDQILIQLKEVDGFEGYGIDEEGYDVEINTTYYRNGSAVYNKGKQVISGYYEIMKLSNEKFIVRKGASYDNNFEEEQVTRFGYKLYTIDSGEQKVIYPYPDYTSEVKQNRFGVMYKSDEKWAVIGENGKVVTQDVFDFIWVDGKRLLGSKKNENKDLIDDSEESPIRKAFIIMNLTD